MISEAFSNTFTFQRVLCALLFQFFESNFVFHNAIWKIRSIVLYSRPLFKRQSRRRQRYQRKGRTHFIKTRHSLKIKVLYWNFIFEIKLNICLLVRML